MNNTIKSLQIKIDNLERKLEKLENKSQDITDNLGFSIWTKKFINLNILNKRQILIKSIVCKPGSHLFFQLKIKFLNYSTQEIKFDLLCDNIQIGSESNLFENNIFETTVSGTFQNKLASEFKIELYINPKNSKQLTLIESTLTVWGIPSLNNEEYNAIETDSNYLLSYISNNRLYYKLFDKLINPNDVEFKFLLESFSHSFCKNNRDIYLFHVDKSGNLFFGNIINPHLIFISQNVSKISSCFFNNSLYFAYISNGECFYSEIFNNSVISNKKIDSIFGKFKYCYLYANDKNNKCYLILTKEDNSNYLLENMSNNFHSSESISAEIKLNISTEAGE